MKWIIVALLCVFTISLSAQTSTRTLAWDHPGETLAAVQADSYTLKVGAGAAVVVIPTCALAATTVTCTTPLVASGSPIVVTRINAFGSASGTLTGATPNGPVNIKVTVVVTVP